MTQTTPVYQTAGTNLVAEDTIEVRAPLNEVYRRWTDFQRYPDFMTSVERVQPLGNNRYHWVARIFGVKQEWDAETTERQENRRIVWRNTTGPYSMGTVTFDPRGDNRTGVRVRLEYAPPGGRMVQTLDQVTGITQREVTGDLKNFKRMIEGQMGISQEVYGEGLRREVPGGAGSLVGSLAAPIAVTVAGGIAAYNLEKRMRRTRAYREFTSPVIRPGSVTGWALTGAGVASTIGATTLRLRGQVSDALFVGQLAPTFLSYATLARLIGYKGLRPGIGTSVTGWTYLAGSLGAILTATTLYLMGRREQGLFVGQLAPTLASASIFSRLFNRLLAR
ncbi:MAG: hypothetical protein OJF49_003907 [Ktedonobacterales bacterium]|nr:MAG: hypothetical protein OJF49_003907 [Ktedonobacterales bacterium]